MARASRTSAHASAKVDKVLPGKGISLPDPVVVEPDPRDAPDPTDPGNRRLSVIKNNLAPPPEPIGMRVGERGPRFGPAPEPPSPNPELDRAVDFLREQLAGGPTPARLLKARYHAAGLSDATVNRAKKKLAIRSYRPPGQRHWFWALPDEMRKS